MTSVEISHKVLQKKIVILVYYKYFAQYHVLLLHHKNKLQLYLITQKQNIALLKIKMVRTQVFSI